MAPHLSFRKLLVACTLLLFGAIPSTAQKKTILLTALQEELTRAFDLLNTKGDPPPYFIGYNVTETAETEIVASVGALRDSRQDVERLLDVDVRIGDYQVDNTRKLRGDRRGFSPYSYSSPVNLPLDNDLDAIKSLLWLQTDKEYRIGVQNFVQIEANRAVNVDEQDTSADFSREPALEALQPIMAMDVEKGVWEEKIRRISRTFAQWPKLTRSFVLFRATTLNKYAVNSEGTAIQHGVNHARIFLYAVTKAEDGEELYLYRAFDAHSLEGLPNDYEVERAIKEMVDQLMALREAPFVEAYSGPAILSGRAGGVYFHETLGHRLEGHRQKDEDGGQTFTKKVGEAILPPFVSIYDDPTIREVNGVELNGYYHFDDEGVKAERVPVVENGVLKNFLLSRSPVEGFTRSNGHGRRAPGRSVVGRQGNFIVTATNSVSSGELRRLLIEECHKQNKPFGLYFEEISGGFTFVGRFIPQFFKVTPIVVWRIWADGRPDELVRGVDLIGTPLTSISQIIACGDDVGVFNGTCGAESGPVPVSAVSPSFLTALVEVQKKAKSTEKPPALPAPDDDDNPSAGEQPE
ncbi:MAG: TldD/PmbA family protein [Ignavibacteriae bacterium]|nr:TldD/PmbA family protein [Ignavibacteriota bacterium]MCB9214815.1 TldD/PmbA family protein [Ignavibacteria bacterium]